MGSAPASSLEASKEQLAGQDGSVLFARAGRVGNRTLRKHSLFLSHGVLYRLATSHICLEKVASSHHTHHRSCEFITYRESNPTIG